MAGVRSIISKKNVGQPKRGGPRAGDGSTAKAIPKGATPRSYETHPSKAKDRGVGTGPMTKKMGSNPKN